MKIYPVSFGKLIDCYDKDGHIYCEVKVEDEYLIKSIVEGTVSKLGVGFELDKELYGDLFDV